MTHTEANTRCHEHGGYLAEINDEDELDFISNGVLNNLGDDDYHYTRIGTKWSGTVARHSDAGKWVFMTSGGDVTYTYTLPGYTLPQEEGVCLALWRDYDSVSHRWDGDWYMWSEYCSLRDNIHNLCEIPAA